MGSQEGYVVLAAALAEAGRDEEARVAYAELCQRAPGPDPAKFRRLVDGFAPDAERARAISLAIYRAAGVDPPEEV